MHNLLEQQYPLKIVREKIYIKQTNQPLFANQQATKVTLTESMSSVNQKHISGVAAISDLIYMRYQKFL